MIQQEIKAAPAASLSCLFVGRDRAGHWVVKDARSLCGGLFANRTEAIRFAMYECQRRPQSVIMLPEGLELDGPLDEHDAGGSAKRSA
jgi:1-acyl-sn-glycerol-3-phosphate acyltransferase